MLTVIQFRTFCFPNICLKIYETIILRVVVYGHETWSQSKERTRTEGFFFFFSRVVLCILIPSSLLFIQLDAQLECLKRMLKFTLKFTSKGLLHVSV
jgi:hypothetical protein